MDDFFSIIQRICWFSQQTEVLVTATKYPQSNTYFSVWLNNWILPSQDDVKLTITPAIKYSEVHLCVLDYYQNAWPSSALDDHILGMGRLGFFFFPSHIASEDGAKGYIASLMRPQKSMHSNQPPFVLDKNSCTTFQPEEWEAKILFKLCHIQQPHTPSTARTVSVCGHVGPGSYELISICNREWKYLLERQKLPISC